ncbi:MAG: substrate-binding periplasmic protein [Telluria sp.]
MLLAPAVHADEITFLVDTGTEMPMARFKGWKVVEGIQYDIGQALAQAMGRSAKFVVLPRQRMVSALENGSADVLCSYVPQWLPGNFDWSQPFLPTVEVLLTNGAAERPHKLADVAGKAVGTVLGYRHLELEKVLGKDFVRDDGPTTEASLRKLAVGRMQHAITSEFIYLYRTRKGDLPITLHPPLVVERYMTQCAVAPTGRVKVADVNAGIAKLVRDDTVAKIVARYR